MSIIKCPCIFQYACNNSSWRNESVLIREVPSFQECPQLRFDIILINTYIRGILVAVETKNQLFPESVKVSVRSLSIWGHLVKVL